MYAGHWLACVSSGDAMLLVFFSDKGKLGALELMQRKCHYQYKFSVFGQPWELSSGVFQKLQEFTCHLFVPKSATTDAIINPSLPASPMQRLLIPAWTACKPLSRHLEMIPAMWTTLLDPASYGWTTDAKGNLDIQWMPESSSPKTVLWLMNYRCVVSIPAKLMNAYALVMDSNAQRYASSKLYQVKD